LKICAAGILVKNKKILLGKRSYNLEFYPGTWDIIGGHLKESETPEQALSRELKEEIGVTPTTFVLIAVLHDPEPLVHGDYEYNIFLVTDWRGSPRNLAPSEHEELRWVKISDALTLDLAHPYYPELFKNIEKGIGSY
jgi:8-oxo-dGTP diphosphatase